MTDPQETENLKRAMILEAIESEPVKQGQLLVVVIGINEYDHQPKLKNAVKDALGLQETLVKLGFAAPIIPLLNETATRAAIFSLVEDRLYDMVEEDDSLILFFAGHGQTRVRKVRIDRDREQEIETGYLVPVDAKQSWSEYIEIDSFLKSLSALPARHILVILDSCHSGFALGQAMQSFRDTTRFETDLSNRISRKVITSARRDQLALDGGSILGHSLFTGTLIEGFNYGKADLDCNGLISSSELGLFLQQQVGQASQSKQTPDFGSFYLDDRGEMVISLWNQSLDAEIGEPSAMRDRLEMAARRWRKNGKRDTELLKDWEVVQAYCWKTSPGAKNSKYSQNVDEFVEKSMEALGDAAYWEILLKRYRCIECGTRYKLENLSLCTNCGPGLYCYECVNNLPKCTNGNLQCSDCGGEVVG
jgi:hypothetical protein